MKREFKSLSQMSFSLPEGWSVSTDKYFLENGQGFFNEENYISKDGKVISFFAVFQNGEAFIEKYINLTNSYTEERDGLVKEKNFYIKLNGFSFPVFILKGNKEKEFHMVQVFIDCGEGLGCFMFYIDKLSDNDKETISSNPVFMDVIKILRTVQ